MQRIHFIAIGGAAMHNIAIALSKKGFKVTGSDDEIFEPSLSRLKAAGILPDAFGWFPQRITPDIDTVVLGMHARSDNPELLKAQELGLNIVSFPEFLFQQTKNKQRVVVAGSHGKTTTTAMILHALRFAGKTFDYMVGSQIDGFDLMADISDNAPLAVFEGDEYLSSPIDRRSKFLWYQPHLAIITGIEWDHMNVFPTFESYINAFRLFAQKIPANGKLFCCSHDEVLKSMISKGSISCEVVFYDGLPWQQINGASSFQYRGKTYRTSLFGDHNFQNMHAALLVCLDLGIDADLFCRSMESFSGAKRRLQTILAAENPIYYDFAHAPSKVRATVKAVKALHPKQKVVAAYELHTFSSLNRDFIPHYAGTFDLADEVMIFFSPDTLKHKNMPLLDAQFIKNSVKHPSVNVYTAPEPMFEHLSRRWNDGSVVLLMTSGNFGGFNPIAWVDNLPKK